MTTSASVERARERWGDEQGSQQFASGVTLDQANFSLSGPVAGQIALPADQIVFQVTHGSGFVPELTATLVSPALTIYGDGRVYAMTPDSWSTPPVLRTGQVDVDTLGQFILQTGERAVAVYALGAGFDENLSRAQIQVREELSTIISDATALATDLTEAVPEVLRAWDLGAADSKSSALPEWTGPALSEFTTAGISNRKCVEITEGIRVLYAAALDNEDGVWRTTEGPRTTAVTPLLSGQGPCER